MHGFFLVCWEARVSIAGYLRQRPNVAAWHAPVSGFVNPCVNPGPINLRILCKQHEAGEVILLFNWIAKPIVDEV
ncbi:MAG: hypothetical protein AAFQ13_11750, partial [Pseudomonadota bacterium]